MANLKKFDQFGRFGLVDCIVASYILDAYLRSDQDQFAIDIDEMASGLDTTGAEVRNACQRLQSKGFFQFESVVDWPDVGSMYVKGIALASSAGQLTLKEEPQKTTVTRTELGFDQFEGEEGVLRCTVKPQVVGDEHTGWYVLNAVWNPDSEKERPVAVDVEYESPDQAWQWWDEYTAAQTPKVEPSDEGEPDPEEPNDADVRASLDPLFALAVKKTVETGHVSTASLQRALTIGFQRSTKIIESLLEHGVINPKEGKGPWEAAMDADAAKALLDRLGIPVED